MMKCEAPFRTRLPIPILQMKSNTAIALVAGILIGAGGSWILRPSHVPESGAQPVSGSSRAIKIPRQNAEDLERNRVAKRWLDRMEGGAFEKTVGEIPAGDLEAVIGKMMSSMWGGMNDEQAGQLSKLISAWAEKDPEEALAWARGLDSPPAAGNRAGVGGGHGREERPDGRLRDLRGSG